MILFMLSAANSIVAQTVKARPGTAVPFSFNDGTELFVFNLFLMTAATFLGAMMLGMQCQRIWMQRFFDRPKNPVTIYRMILLLAAAAMTVRCGAGAMELWGWNPDDPTTTARVSMAKRWLDPIDLSGHDVDGARDPW